MAKIILEFDSTEESDDARVALDGYKWKIAMWDLDQLLRATTKYGAGLVNKGQEATSEESHIAETLREEIRRILNDYNLSLND